MLLIAANVQVSNPEFRRYVRCPDILQNYAAIKTQCLKTKNIFIKNNANPEFL